MKATFSEEIDKALKTISTDRIRTNLLRKPEQKTLAYLVTRIPSWVNSDMLTSVGLLGSLIVLLSFILAAYIHTNWLLLGLLGFLINWFGDSLDGRIAIYRNRSRKWYGFALDVITDWLGILLIGLGYIIYTSGPWEMLGYVFVVLYGWGILTTLLKYKITGEYAIDPGLFGPTEGRILVCLILFFEVLIPGSIIYTLGALTAFVFSINITDTAKLLRLADRRDKREKIQAAIDRGEKKFLHVKHVS
jgi:hypothetical protein